MRANHDRGMVHHSSAKGGLRRGGLRRGLEKFPAWEGGGGEKVEEA